VDKKKVKDSSDQHGLTTEDTGKARLRIVKSRSSGMDPYDGALAQKPPSNKKDLRKLGEWLEAKRRAEELQRAEAERSSNTHTTKGRGKKD
jgi:hypothetical protein